jgi:hypothetical protein
MNRFYIIIGVLALALLSASCAKSHQAENVVEAFVDANALHPEKMVTRDFARFDSTKAIGDSLVLAMQARKHELYRHPISYADSRAGRMLYLVRMNFVYEGDTLWQTFYLDEKLDHVVAFK